MSSKGLRQPTPTTEKIIIGWNEWIALPELSLPAVKAKIDTGAKTSALHAFDIEVCRKNSKDFANFCIHPIQRNDQLTVRCTAPIVDERFVMSSNGHKEHRYVITTPLRLGDCEWDILITLSNRDPLTFRLLLGREALQGRVIIDPHRSMCQGILKSKAIREMYRDHE